MFKSSTKSSYEVPVCEVAVFAACSPLLDNSFNTGIDDWTEVGDLTI